MDLGMWVNLSPYRLPGSGMNGRVGLGETVVGRVLHTSRARRSTWAVKVTVKMLVSLSPV